MNRRHSLGVALLTLALGLAACEEEAPGVQARRITTRADLIGGPSALGEVGDYLIENEKIRIIVQDKGFSRGFGVYGGSLIDIDLQRPTAPGGPAGGNGRDQFGELFPVAFLQALVPQNVEIIADGSDGKPAQVRVSGNGGDFLSMTKALNQAVLNSHELPANPLDVFNADLLNGDPQIAYEVIYEMPPDARYVRIRVRMTNITEGPLKIPSTPGELALRFLGIDPSDFNAPLGFVLLFGAGNKVFSPGAGYDVRFALEDAYAEGAGRFTFPALPGLLTSGLISTSTNGISYGFFALPDDNIENFVASRQDENGVNPYEDVYGVDVGSDTMLVPFLASSFTGVFYAQAPKVIEAGQTVEYSNYLVVGDGDVASVMNAVHGLRGDLVHEVLGVVADQITGERVADASVVIYDASGHPVNQFYTDAWGRFRGTMPPGEYTARVERDPLVSDPVPFRVAADAGEVLALAAPTAGHLVVEVRDGAGRPLPAKVSVVGTIDPAFAGQLARRHLFDLGAGQRWRTVDAIPDDPANPDTLRYIENQTYTDDGKALIDIPPGKPFQVYVSRGPEYSLARIDVQVAAGKVEHVAAQLRRVVDTRGYVSGDFHLHARPSLDSDLHLDERVRSVIGEGVEILVATDHNFITDYRPTIDKLELQDWATSLVGLELTTLESGHFNGYPLRRDVGAITRGAFEWSLQPPDYLFDTLRSLGELGPERTIVQVNHPRDSILGYFAQYDLDPLTGAVPESTCGAGGIDLGCAVQPNGPAFRDADGMSTFSYGFDALEVLNGSIVGQVKHERMPANIAGLQIPDETRADLPAPGTILCEDGAVAFPGAEDDWFNLLNLGYRTVGMGTSDSHDASDHTGYGRSYLYVGTDDPSMLTPGDIVDAIQSHRVLMSNGPFMEFTVDGHPMGSELKAGGDGKVSVRIDAQAAPWMDVNHGYLYVNGEIAERFPVEMENGRFIYETQLTLPADGWIVAEIGGDASLFPVIRPVDVPPVLLQDAFSSIAGPLGLGGSAFGDLEPSRVGPFAALAITNPIWVDVDGNGFEPPGALPRSCEGFGVITEKSGRIPAHEVIGRSPPAAVLRDSFAFPRLKGDIQDVRVLFEQFGRHNH
ncbi:MAG: CehA/McbA family metallohydrolase [Myxococcales bacterium]|nr:CehA/McbA family metallohydrolase [Myxococcales bacterium]